MTCTACGCSIHSVTAEAADREAAGVTGTPGADTGLSSGATPAAVAPPWDVTGIPEPQGSTSAAADPAECDPHDWKCQRCGTEFRLLPSWYPAGEGK